MPWKGLITVAACLAYYPLLCLQIDFDASTVALDLIADLLQSMLTFARLSTTQEEKSMAIQEYGSKGSSSISSMLDAAATMDPQEQAATLSCLEAVAVKHHIYSELYRMFMDPPFDSKYRRVRLYKHMETLPYSDESSYQMSFLRYVVRQWMQRGLDREIHDLPQSLHAEVLLVLEADHRVYRPATLFVHQVNMDPEQDLQQTLQLMAEDGDPIAAAIGYMTAASEHNPLHSQSPEMDASKAVAQAPFSRMLHLASVSQLLGQECSRQGTHSARMLKKAVANLDTQYDEAAVAEYFSFPRLSGAVLAAFIFSLDPQLAHSYGQDWRQAWGAIFGEGQLLDVAGLQNAGAPDGEVQDAMRRTDLYKALQLSLLGWSREEWQSNLDLVQQTFRPDVRSPGASLVAVHIFEQCSVNSVR